MTTDSQTPRKSTKSLVARIIRKMKKKSSKTKEIERLQYEMSKQTRLIAQLNRQISELQNDRRDRNKALYQMAAPKKRKSELRVTQSICKPVKFASQNNISPNKVELNSSLSVLL